MNSHQLRAKLGIDPILNNGQFFNALPDAMQADSALHFPIPESADEVPAFFQRHGNKFRRDVRALCDEFMQWAKAHHIETHRFKKSMQRIITFDGTDPERNHEYFELLHTGIPTLARILVLLRSTDILDTDKTLIIETLEKDIDKCAPGIHTHLSIAYLALLSRTHVVAHLYQYRTEVAQTIALELLNPYVNRHEIHPGMEIHYTNAYLNAHTDLLAITPITDPYTHQCIPDYYFFRTFKEKLRKKLTAVRFIAHCAAIESEVLNQYVSRLNENLPHSRDNRFSDALEDYELHLNASYGMDRNQQQHALDHETTHRLFGSAADDSDLNESTVLVHAETEKRLADAYQDIYSDTLLLYSVMLNDLIECSDEGKVMLHWKAPYALSLTLLYRLIQNLYFAIPHAGFKYHLKTGESVQIFANAPLTWAHIHFHAAHNGIHTQPFLTWIAESLHDATQSRMITELLKNIHEALDRNAIDDRDEIFGAVRRYLKSSDFEDQTDDQIVHYFKHLQSILPSHYNYFLSLLSIDEILALHTPELLRDWLETDNQHNLSRKHIADCCALAVREPNIPLCNALIQRTSFRNGILAYIDQKAHSNQYQFLEIWLEHGDNLDELYAFALRQASHPRHNPCLFQFINQWNFETQQALVLYGINHSNLAYRRYLLQHIPVIDLYRIALSIPGDNLLKILHDSGMQSDTYLMAQLTAHTPINSLFMHHLKRLTTTYNLKPLTEDVVYLIARQLLTTYNVTALSELDLREIHDLLIKQPLSAKHARDLYQSLDCGEIYRLMIHGKTPPLLFSVLLLINAHGIDQLFSVHEPFVAETSQEIHRVATYIVKNGYIELFVELCSITYIDTDTTTRQSYLSDEIRCELFFTAFNTENIALLHSFILNASNALLGRLLIQIKHYLSFTDCTPNQKSVTAALLKEIFKRCFECQRNESTTHTPTSLMMQYDSIQTLLPELSILKPSTDIEDVILELKQLIQKTGMNELHDLFHILDAYLLESRRDDLSTSTHASRNILRYSPAQNYHKNGRCLFDSAERMNQIAIVILDELQVLTPERFLQLCSAETNSLARLFLKLKFHLTQCAPKEREDIIQCIFVNQAMLKPTSEDQTTEAVRSPIELISGLLDSPICSTPLIECLFSPRGIAIMSALEKNPLSSFTGQSLTLEYLKYALISKLHHALQHIQHLQGHTRMRHFHAPWMRDQCMLMSLYLELLLRSESTLETLVLLQCINHRPELQVLILEMNIPENITESSNFSTWIQCCMHTELSSMMPPHDWTEQHALICIDTFVRDIISVVETLSQGHIYSSLQRVISELREWLQEEQRHSRHATVDEAMTGRTENLHPAEATAGSMSVLRL